MHDLDTSRRPLSIMALLSAFAGIIALLGPLYLFVDSLIPRYMVFGARIGPLPYWRFLLLISLVGGVSAVVLGHLGIPATRASGGQKGWSLAIAGLIMGYTFLTGVLIAVLMGLASLILFAG